MKKEKYLVIALVVNPDKSPQGIYQQQRLELSYNNARRNFRGWLKTYVSRHTKGISIYTVRGSITDADYNKKVSTELLNKKSIPYYFLPPNAKTKYSVVGVI